MKIPLNSVISTAPLSSTKSMFIFTGAIKTFVIPSLCPFLPLINVLRVTRFVFSPLELTLHRVSVSGLFPSLRRSRRSFWGGHVVAMAIPGSVQKSEEEWYAILSPEQFRILRQKGIE